MIKKPVRLINFGIAITILIGSLLFLQQQHFHIAFSRDINAKLEMRNMDSLELALQEGLNYPLGSGDRLAVARLTDKFIRNDYIYSIEVRDSNGELVASATSEKVPTERGVKIYTRTVKIIDDRPIESLDIDDASSTQTIRGTVKLRLTTYETQDQLDSALKRHWIVLSAAIFLIGCLVIAFPIVFRRDTKHVKEALEKIAGKEYVSINYNVWIREIAEIVEGVNALSATLEKSERNLEKTNRIKHKLLRMFSKELEDPIQTLHGLLQIVNESVSEDDLDTEIVGYLRMCKSYTDVVLGILNQLKVFNLLDSEKLRYHEKSVFLENFFDLLYDEYLPQIDSSINFSVVALPVEDYTLSQAYIVTDEHKLLVIVRNILSNAVKYTLRGSIRVEWGLYSKNDSATSLLIRFEDTGAGIEANNIQSVFEEYFREAPEDSGFGLGLTIAKSYLDVLGGNIQLQSLKNMGTKVEVSIPVRSSGSVVTPIGKLPQYDFSALIIDDNENVCQYLIQMLNQYGVTADGLRNPTQALTAVAEGSYTMVFIDDRMNQVRGVDLARHIGATGKNVVMVYMTSQPDEGINADIFSAIDSAGTAVFSLRKPILQSALEDMLHEVACFRATIKVAFARFENNAKDKKSP